MKRRVCLFLIVLTVILACAGITACKDKPKDVQSEDKYLGTSDANLLLEGMSAFELFGEAYANWLADDGYLREETLDFSVSSKFLGLMGTREMQTTRKIDGDRIYNFEITKGDGVTSDMTSAKIYYYDGDKAHIVTTSDKKNMDFGNGRFSVKEWGAFGQFDGDVQKENAFLAKRWTVYDLTQRESLAKEHNDGVYAANGNYYFTLTIDCSKEALKKYQPVLLAEYTANMSAPEDSYSMENTKIDVAVREIDGKMKFVAWYRTETYTGKARNIMETTCRETCYNKLTYTGYGITAAELPDLA